MDVQVVTVTDKTANNFCFFPISINKPYVQIPLDGSGQTLCLVRSSRVVSKFHQTDPTRRDSRTAWDSDKCADFVQSQTCPLYLDVYGQCSWVCIQWNLTRTKYLVVSGPVRVVEFRNDTTTPDQRQSLARSVPNSTTSTRTDPTRQSLRTCRKPARTQQTLSETRSLVRPAQWNMDITRNLAAHERRNCHFRCPSFCAVSILISPLK